jgi:hypothetical protein
MKLLFEEATQECFNPLEMQEPKTVRWIALEELISLLNKDFIHKDKAEDLQFFGEKTSFHFGKPF